MRAFVLVLWMLASVAQAATSVHVDLRALDAETARALDAATLEQVLVVRLVQEGFAVVADDATVVLGVEASADEVRLVRGSEVVRVPRARPLPELHVELAQRAVALVREAPVPVVNSDPLMVVAPPAPTPVVPAPAPAPWKPSPSIGVEAWIRNGGVDFAPRVQAAVGLGRFEGVVSLAAAPSGAVGLSVLEWQAQLGGRLGFDFAERWRFSVGLLAGLGLHHFWFSEDGSAMPWGTRAAVVVAAPLELAGRVLETPLRLGIRVAPAVSSLELAHRRNGETLWRRGPFRLEVGAGLSIDL